MPKELTRSWPCSSRWRSDERPPRPAQGIPAPHGDCGTGYTEASAELLLEVMDPGAAKLLRLCAIPHQFDADIVHTLAPRLDRAEIQQRCEEFARLSFVCADADGWALHDGVRRHFFSQWLMPQSAEEFASASRRLAAFFKERARRSQGEPAETARRARCSICWALIRNPVSGSLSCCFVVLAKTSCIANAASWSGWCESTTRCCLPATAYGSRITRQSCQPICAIWKTLRPATSGY